VKGVAGKGGKGIERKGDGSLNPALHELNQPYSTPQTIRWFAECCKATNTFYCAF